MFLFRSTIYGVGWTNLNNWLKQDDFSIKNQLYRLIRLLKLLSSVSSWEEFKRKALSECCRIASRWCELIKTVLSLARPENKWSISSCDGGSKCESGSSSNRTRASRIKTRAIIIFWNSPSLNRCTAVLRKSSIPTSETAFANRAFHAVVWRLSILRSNEAIWRNSATVIRLRISWRPLR